MFILLRPKDIFGVLVVCGCTYATVRAVEKVHHHYYYSDFAWERRRAEEERRRLARCPSRNEIAQYVRTNDLEKLTEERCNGAYRFPDKDDCHCNVTDRIVKYAVKENNREVLQIALDAAKSEEERKDILNQTIAFGNVKAFETVMQCNDWQDLHDHDFWNATGRSRSEKILDHPRVRPLIEENKGTLSSTIGWRYSKQGVKARHPEFRKKYNLDTEYDTKKDEPIQFDSWYIHEREANYP